MNALTRPLATIIVRAYNQESIVSDAIESCFRQTYSPLEIILSDDCSSDGTWTIIEKMAAGYTGPHKVIATRNPENLGIVEHTNKTMERASGLLILSCAGDDIALPERTERLVSEWSASPETAKAVSSGYIKMSLEGEDLGVVSALRSMRRKAEPTALDVAKNRAWCVGAATLWHRDVIDVFGPIPPSAWAEDRSLLLRAAVLGEVRYIDTALLRKRMGGISNPTGKPIVEGYFRRAKKMCIKEIGTMQALLQDIEASQSESEHALKAACKRRLGELLFEKELGELDRRGRLAHLPGAFLRTALNLRPGYLAAGLKYSFPDAYTAYRRRRYG